MQQNQAPSEMIEYLEALNSFLDDLTEEDLALVTPGIALTVPLVCKYKGWPDAVCIDVESKDQGQA